LVAKTLPQTLNSVLSDVVAIVNFIKVSALNTRLFRKLCQDSDADHDNLIYHTEVRWLSIGKFLSRFVGLKEELVMFFAMQTAGKAACHHEKLNNEEWMLKVAYLRDIFAKINDLNKSLQGSETTVLDFSDKLRAFIMKLELWKERVSSGSFDMFDSLSAELSSDESEMLLKELVVEHLSAMAQEMQQYFPDLDEIDLKLVRNPFRIKVSDIDIGLQEELIDLINDSGAHDKFDDNSLTMFWCAMITSYPRLSRLALRALLIFPSTYKCEQGFSSMFYLKNKYRSALNVDDDLRVALSKTEPNVQKLTNSNQQQQSH
jgi:hypothetical protein